MDFLFVDVDLLDVGLLLGLRPGGQFANFIFIPFELRLGDKSDFMFFVLELGAMSLNDLLNLSFKVFVLVL